MPSMEETRLLIVNADDLGRSAGVTEGILRAHHRGIVTSATTMVNLPDAEAGVRRACCEAPCLGLGVHLNLTAGPPVLAPELVPTLVGSDGWFHPVRRVVQRLEDLDVGEVRAEMTAQIERFRSWRLEPTHLDCHHHALYLSPRLFRVLVELADQYGLPIRYPWPREVRSPDEVALLAEAHRVAVADLPGIMASCQAILDTSGVPVPGRCILSFYGQRATREHLLDLVADVSPGVAELMCHPGVVDAGLRATSGYAEWRERELAVLTDPQVRTALEAAGVRLVSYLVLA